MQVRCKIQRTHVYSHCIITHGGAEGIRTSTTLISKSNERVQDCQCTPRFIEIRGPRRPRRSSLRTATAKSPCMLAAWIRNYVFEYAKSTPRPTEAFPYVWVSCGTMFPLLGLRWSWWERSEIARRVTSDRLLSPCAY